MLCFSNLVAILAATLREIYHPDEAALAALSEEFGAYKYINFQEDGGKNTAGRPALNLLGITTMIALGRALV